MTNAQKENYSIIVIATTDLPWNLENDLLNLMKTKIQTKMISTELRSKYIKNIGNCEMTEAETEEIVQKTEGMKILDFKSCIKAASE